MTPEERMNAPTPKTFVGAIGAIGEINFVVDEAINFVVVEAVVEVAETAEQRARRKWGMEEQSNEPGEQTQQDGD